jgi:hypothetical protein
VSLADNIWRGRRLDELEAKVTAMLAAATGVESWAAWMKFDALCEEIASKGEERLTWQRVGGAELSR